MRSEGGFGLTHEGSVSRSDGKSFSPEEATNFLKVLQLFLSFARGANCGITGITGKDDHGRLAWEQWGSYSTYPWWSLSSWLDHRLNNARALCKAFPGFWRIFGQTTINPDNPVNVALYWYLRSNENTSLAGIILTQAALERLAYHVVPSSNNKITPVGRIRVALRGAGIDLRIPKSLIHKS